MILRHTLQKWHIFASYLAPVFPSQRFCREIYYKHFVKLVALAKTCLLFSLNTKDIEELKQEFIDLLDEYERYGFSYCFLETILIV